MTLPRPQWFDERVLVEREPQLALLSTLAAEAGAGAGRLVFVGGEAGVGKTSLVRALADAAGARTVVRRGFADGVTTAAPLAAVLEAVPEVASAAGDRLALFQALRAALAAEPGILVLEDLHWADEATLDALRYLGRRLDGIRTLVVVTYRHDEVPPHHPLAFVMGDLGGLAGVSRLLVPPLTPDGVAALVRAASAPVDAAALHARTGGNAFYATEVIAGAGSDDLGGADGVPESVRDAVLARVARLPTAARAVVEAGAILGTAAPLDLLVAVSGQTPSDVDTCLERGVLVTAGAGIGFRHELARLAVEGSLPAARRQALHRRALDLLAVSEPDDHRTLAHHAAGCGDRAGAVRWARLAAERSARLGAHREAAAQLRAALQAASGPAAERAALYEALSYECYLTDQLPEALTARRRALELHELAGATAQVGTDLRWLSRLSWFSGHGDDAGRYGERAVATLEPLGDGAELAMAYSNLSQLRMLSQDTAEAAVWGRRALELARRVGDKQVEIHALNNLGTAATLAGDPARGTALLRRSLELALDVDAHEHAARAWTNLGALAVVQHRLVEGQQTLAEGIAYCTDRDLDSWARYMSAWHATTLAELGQFDEAAAEAAQVLSHPNVAPVSAIPAAAVLARVRERRGEDGSEPRALASRLAAGTGETQRVAPAACAEAEAAWLDGRAGDIPAATDEAWRLALEHPDPWLLGELAWWRSLAGAAPDVPPGTSFAEPFALMLDGDAAGAAAAWSAAGAPVWEAYALVRSPSPADAERMVALLHELGAERALDAALRARRDAGLPVPRRPRGANRQRFGQLTARESDVLLLLAEGLSTADIAERLVLSRRTVEHHVGAVLRKLGEPTRGRAVAAARRAGVLDPS